MITKSTAEHTPGPRTTIKVAVVRRVILGIEGFHARCLSCCWNGRGRDNESSALADAKKHACATPETTAGHTPGPLFARLDSDTEFMILKFYRVETAAGRIVADTIVKEGDAVLFAAAPETAAERDRLREENAELAKALAQAVRYIEVTVAYQGAMTAAEVERAIRQNENMEATSVGANSCNTLATFNFYKARAALDRHAKAEGSDLV